MNAIQKKRAELEQRRAVIDAQLALLAELDADGPADAAPPPTPVMPGKPVPRPKREPTVASDQPVSAGERRDAILRLLAANPDGLTSTEIETQVGYEGVGYYLKHPWFEKSDPAYRLSPWVLTEAGESAAEKLSRATAPAT